MSNAEDKIVKAKNVVLKFASHWSEWEREMAKDKGSMHKPHMKEAHANLIKTHCTIKKRAYVDGLLTYQRPPTYEDVIEKNIINTELANNSRAHVDIKCALRYLRFVVLKKKDGWRIDSIKWKISETDSWENGLIGL